MDFSIKLVERDAQIVQGILNGFLPDVTKHINKGVRTIKSQLPNIVRKIVTETPEYTSLVNGTLKFELGIPDAASQIAGLIDIWAGSIYYKYSPPVVSSGKITASFGAYTFKSDFSDVLGTQYALVIDGIRGYSLPWLEWLVLQGNTPIIRDHKVVYGFSNRSRTNNAVMLAHRSKNWSIPTEYAGNISDNWITRSIEKSKEIQLLLDRAFK